MWTTRTKPDRSACVGSVSLSGNTGAGSSLVAILCPSSGALPRRVPPRTVAQWHSRTAHKWADAPLPGLQQTVVHLPPIWLPSGPARLPCHWEAAVLHREPTAVGGAGARVHRAVPITHLHSRWTPAAEHAIISTPQCAVRSGADLRSASVALRALEHPPRTLAAVY